jgi:hypothetical protein
MHHPGVLAYSKQVWRMVVVVVVVMVHNLMQMKQFIYLFVSALTTKGNSM